MVDFAGDCCPGVFSPRSMREGQRASPGLPLRCCPLSATLPHMGRGSLLCCARHEGRHRRLPRHQPRARHGDRAGHAQLAHAPRMIWHTETDLGGLDLVVIPGGFSYGDYLRCGAMAAHSPVMTRGARARGARRLSARRLQRLPDPDRGRPPARRAAAQCLAAVPVDGLPSARRTQPTPPSPAATSAARCSAR